MENASKIENLFQQEAIDKCKELVKHQSVCLFSTDLMDAPQKTRPMSVQEVDEDGNFWFMSSGESDKNAEIKADPQVQLYFQNTSDYEFLTVYGNATISRDRERIDKYWSDIAKAWFPQGKEDPHITLIKVKPINGFYWDTKSGKFISLIKIVASAIMGKTLEEGIEGSLSNM